MTKTTLKTKPKIHQVFLAVLTCVSIICEFFYPHYTVLAANLINPTPIQTNGQQDFALSMNTEQDFNGAQLPTTNQRKPRSVLSVLATAYSSTPDQTDGDPLTTAWGTQVHDGIIASNFLPLGAYVKIPSLYGNKFFRVEDRMNPRYDMVIDVWMSSRGQAKQFGVQNARIEIY